MRHEIYYPNGLLPCCKVKQPTNLPLPFICNCTEMGNDKKLAPCSYLGEKKGELKCDRCAFRGNIQEYYECKLHGNVTLETSGHSSIKMWCTVCRAGDLGYKPIDN